MVVRQTIIDKIKGAIGVQTENEDIRLKRRNNEIRDHSTKLEFQSLRKVNNIDTLDYSDFDALNREFISFKNQKTFINNFKFMNQCRGYKGTCPDNALVEVRYGVLSDGVVKTLEKYHHCKKCISRIGYFIRSAREKELENKQKLIAAERAEIEAVLKDKEKQLSNLEQQRDKRFSDKVEQDDDSIEWIDEQDEKKM